MPTKNPTPEQRARKNANERMTYAARTPEEVESRKAYMQDRWHLRRRAMTPGQIEARSVKNQALWANMSPEEKEAKREAQREWHHNSDKRKVAKEEMRIAAEQRRTVAKQERKMKRSEAWASMTPEQREAYSTKRRERYHRRPESRQVVKESHRRWARAHPESARARKHKRRALIRGSEGAYTGREWIDLVEKHDHRCAHCKRHEPEIKLTVDHIVPISKGGTNYISNIQPLCASCNSRKKDRIGA
jgi:5-methylcytosine-specific restriction endonuclease McrA